MHAEKLHELAIDVLQEERSFKLREKFSQLVNALAALVGLGGGKPPKTDQSEPTSEPPPQEPTSPNLEARVGSYRQALTEVLRTVPSNEFVPSQILMLEKLGGSDLIGERLRQKLEGVLDSPQLSVVDTHTDLSALAERYDRFIHTLDRLAGAMRKLGVGRERLHPNEAEVGALLPMETVSLQDVEREARLLNRHLRVLAEVTGEEVQDFRIKALTNDSLWIFVGVGLCTAWSLAKGTAYIADMLENVVRIRSAYDELRKARFGQQLEEAQVAEYIDGQIAELKDELIADFRGEQDRRNELEAGLLHFVRYLVGKAKSGAVFEVKVLAPADPSDESDAPDIEGFSFRVLKERGAAMKRAPSAEELTLIATRELLEAGQKPAEGGGEGDEEPADTESDKEREP